MNYAKIVCVSIVLGAIILPATVVGAETNNNKKTVYDLVISSVARETKKPTKKPTMKERFQGCILGAAAGDASGRVTESVRSTDEIFQQYPGGVWSYRDFKITDWGFVYPHLNKNKIAPYTDDTAMATCVLDVLIDSRKRNITFEETMCAMAHKFINDREMKDESGNAIGGRDLAMCSKEDKEWWKISKENGQAGGCGSVMRAHPFGLAFVHDANKATLWGAQYSYLTHGDRIAVASCAVFANAVTQIFNDIGVDRVMNNAVYVARVFNSDQTAKKIKKVGEYAKQARKLFGQRSKTEFNALHEKVFQKFPGFAADDAIAGALYIYALFPKNLMAGIYTGVHTPGDSESIASMAGALIGASVGIGQIYPKSLLNKLENYQQLKSKANVLYDTVFSWRFYFRSKWSTVTLWFARSWVMRWWSRSQST